MTIDPLVIDTIDRQAAYIAELKEERDRLREALLALNREFPEKESGKPPCWCDWRRDIKNMGHSPKCLEANAALAQPEAEEADGQH